MLGASSNHMNTTSLFVELVVIGVGAAIWVVLLIFMAFGYEWVPSEKALSIPAAIPILAVVYVLGIVSDRMIDILFDYVWGKTFRKKHFPRTGDYHEARRKVLTRSDAMAHIIEYSRSRLRICRGWSVHSILIAITLVVFSWTQLSDHSLRMRVSLFGGLAFCFLGVTSWYAWRYLNTTQYLKVYEQAAFLDRTTDSETGT